MEAAMLASLEEGRVRKGRPQKPHTPRAQRFGLLAPKDCQQLQSQLPSKEVWGEMAQVLERELTDHKDCGLNPTSASRLPLSRLGQSGSISALMLPSSGMAAMHRMGATAERPKEVFETDLTPGTISSALITLLLTTEPETSSKQRSGYPCGLLDKFAAKQQLVGGTRFAMRSLKYGRGN
ncbi:hypothetical protein CSKR_109323 [Clonorchis sinensis]|uniref:Uncharacterized protein n=1 Tax=Clonorchis sinensis TaxID=79923 RepID=A0A3R7FJF1_CLOSI|nr:hypothetical protein CSKR_109323 [Clonorchis sinensis]